MAKAAEAVGAAVAGEAKLDAGKLRADFPIFQQRFHGKPLAYLDSAVSAQKPRQVLDAQREFYETSYTNVHRGVYLLAERATERFEGAREKVRAFINAASTREIVFTRSATEALNLVAYACGASLSRYGGTATRCSPSRAHCDIRVTYLNPVLCVLHARQRLGASAMRRSLTLRPIRVGRVDEVDSELDGIKRLRRVFYDFAQALDFTKKVGELAEDEGHHPALLTEMG